MLHHHYPAVAPAKHGPIHDRDRGNGGVLWRYQIVHERRCHAATNGLFVHQGRCRNLRTRQYHHCHSVSHQRHEQRRRFVPRKCPSSLVTHRRRLHSRIHRAIRQAVIGRFRSHRVQCGSGLCFASLRQEPRLRHHCQEMDHRDNRSDTIAQRNGTIPRHAPSLPNQGTRSARNLQIGIPIQQPKHPPVSPGAHLAGPIHRQAHLRRSFRWKGRKAGRIRRHPAGIPIPGGIPEAQVRNGRLRGRPGHLLPSRIPAPGS
mmetsp:Transcript_18437/g.40146  ORF Transcript_18437/g.40146 Transcript_18437/m.40146 type:complete len:259 (+) Transcript_18437:323-1099(+)